ncbi:primosomal protein N' [Cyanobium sp. CH-040]|uniref:replication restart helicase PriA n=1 Tax=Cyanobium sp. CH-040 TaxID=2823708 RepID=UPI0020CEDD06|nr:primosomal protein N' [Cyanobium sp. CH-040]MCP9928112.1 primosomal protein N' [Cyanobium sp. CH-040]
MVSTASTSTPGWLQIWVEAGREGQVFTYANPACLPLAIGDLVEVGLQGRRHAGLVVDALCASPPEMAGRRLQPVHRLLQPAAVDGSWQRLITAVADRCHTSRFRTLKSALPPGWLGQRRPGHRTAPAPIWYLRVREPRPAGSEEHLSQRQRDLLAHLRRAGAPLPLRSVCGREGFSRSVLHALERRGLVDRERGPAEPAGVEGWSIGARNGNALAPPPPQPAVPPRQLTAAQEEALAAIDSAPAGQALLLWGVTGAGKTEVYLQAAARSLGRGRSVLILAPEIGLIPQLLDRCRERFGARVVEFHSGMGDGARVATWRRCLSGTPLLAVGTRSAVFLPLPALDLIVLDEEHDSSYKQESPMPCYHARDVARLRARLCGARLLLGSATPALETWLACRDPDADTRLLRLPQRIGGRPLPPVRVVDMRQELAEGHRRLLSRPLLDRLSAIRALGEQAVVLVPRRGYHAFLSCRSCGEVVLCPHCDVAMTVHRSRGGREWLRCHWCDHRAELGERCGHCGSTAFKPFGAGTQRVMDQLMAELEGLRVLRFDRDTTRGRDGHRLLLERFAAGEADVLVGTQMLAKGMDLPRVTLAAVLAADGLLHRPDLRAGEQSLQLLLQLAGRAGRGERPGEVLVQTYSPEHPVIRHLVDGRYDRFLAEELELRRHGGLVPFSRACLLRFSGPSASATATAAASVAESILPAAGRQGWCVIGPAPAPVARVAGRSRWQLLLHGPAASTLPLPPEAELRRMLPASVGLAIDPDPLVL